MMHHLVRALSMAFGMFFLAVAALLLCRFFATNGMSMLRGMNKMPDEHAHAV